MGSRSKFIRLLFIFLTLVGIAGCYILFTLIRSNMQHTYETEAALSLAAVERQQELATQAFLSTVGPNVSLLSNRIVGKDGTVSFIEYIESLARAAGVSIQIDSVVEAKVAGEGKNKESKDVESLQLSLSTEGSWEHTYRFVRMLENLPYKSVIQSETLAQDLYADAENQSQKKKGSRDQIRVWRGTYSLNILKRK